MSLEDDLKTRAASKCELCASTDDLAAVDVPPDADGSADHAALLCQNCRDQIDGHAEVNLHHWRCLNDSMWSQTPAVQVMAWRMLTRLNTEGWARDLLEMLYLDDEVLSWAEAGVADTDDDTAPHLDAHGATLESGDTVSLIKDLQVKGAGFTAKRGTAVRNISLVSDNPAQIEGRVNGQHIVILTAFVKKQS